MRIQRAPQNLLELYANEVLLTSMPIHKNVNARNYRRHIKEKWAVLDIYFGKRHLLKEAQLLEIFDLLKGAWEGLKGMASYLGGKAVDGVKWVATNAKDFAGSVLKVLKKIAGKLQEIIVYAIKQLPGGEMVLEFLSKYAGKLKEKFIEMKKAIGKKVEDFVNGAKKKLVDFFFTYVLKDEEMKQDFYHAMGVSPEDLESIKTEARRLKLDSLNELNLHLEVSEKVRKILGEEDKKDDAAIDSVADQIKKKTGIQDAEEMAKALGFIENKGPDAINPEDVLRGKAAGVVEKMIDFWLKLVEKNPKKYHKPFFNSGFFKTFGETGFGLAAASIMGILAAGELKWEEMVTYVKQMVRGFDGGLGRPPGAQTSKAGAYMFLGNKGNNYDASLFKNFVTGIIKGSNLEVIIRALSGDVSKIPDLAKRLMSTLLGAVKKIIGTVTPNAVKEITGEKVPEEAEEGLNDAVGDYVDEVFEA